MCGVRWKRVMLSTFLAVAILGRCSTHLAAQGQPPAGPAARTTAPPATVGRFQLVPDSQGATFLIDSATGRVWRYTKVEPSQPSSEATEKRLNERLVARATEFHIPLGNGSLANQAAEARRLLLAEETARVTREVQDEVQAQLKAEERRINPCHGLVACFVETDRVRLTPDGTTWTSELVGDH